MPQLTRPSRMPPGGRVVTVVVRLGGRWSRGRGAGAATATRRSRPAAADISRRLRAGRRAARRRPTSSSARSSPPARGCSRPSWSTSSRSAATRCPPSRSTPCARTIEEDLGRPLDEVFASFDRTPLAAASIAQVHAGAPAHRRGGGGQGAAPRRRPPRAHRPAGDGVARAAPRRPHPGRRARQPAGAGRAVRRDDRRGARLPARGRQHARHRRACCASSARTATSCPARTPRW